MAKDAENFFWESEDQTDKKTKPKDQSIKGEEFKNSGSPLLCILSMEYFYMLEAWATEALVFFSNATATFPGCFGLTPAFPLSNQIVRENNEHNYG